MPRVGPQRHRGEKNLKEFMSYPTLYPNHTKTYLLMFLRKVYYDNHSKWDTNTLCGQNEVFFDAKAGVTFSYHCVLRG